MQIGKAESNVMENILHAICTRYDAIFPDWELHIVSMHKNGKEIQQINEMVLFPEGLKANYLQK